GRLGGLGALHVEAYEAAHLLRHFQDPLGVLEAELPRDLLAEGAELDRDVPLDPLGDETQQLLLRLGRALRRLAVEHVLAQEVEGSLDLLLVEPLAHLDRRLRRLAGHEAAGQEGERLHRLFRPRGRPSWLATTTEAMPPRTLNRPSTVMRRG